VNATANLRVPLIAGSSWLAEGGPAGFSGRTPLHGVSSLVTCFIQGQNHARRFFKKPKVYKMCCRRSAHNSVTCVNRQVFWECLIQFPTTNGWFIFIYFLFLIFIGMLHYIVLVILHAVTFGVYSLYSFFFLLTFLCTPECCSLFCVHFFDLI
jgi:hypothetical protein